MRLALRFAMPMLRKFLRSRRAPPARRPPAKQPPAIRKGPPE
jgi:hypothetical protein